MIIKTNNIILLLILKANISYIPFCARSLAIAAALAAPSWAFTDFCSASRTLLSMEELPDLGSSEQINPFLYGRFWAYNVPPPLAWVGCKHTRIRP